MAAVAAEVVRPFLHLHSESLTVTYQSWYLLQNMYEWIKLQAASKVVLAAAVVLCILHTLGLLSAAVHWLLMLPLQQLTVQEVTPIAQHGRDANLCPFARQGIDPRDRS